MKMILNGQETRFQADGDESAVDVIRDQCELTGTKLVCGSGACGACTVLLDDVPVNSCCLPAQAMEGRRVTTVENFRGDQLHPMQKAFMACDGLQCGFCTPGFILESIAFYEEWRKKHGKTEPERDQVAEALAGHLCRCGAYLGIYDAVQRACRGDFDETEELVTQRVDALPKVTGEAKYTVDVRYPGQLVGRILRATYGHARVIRLDLEPARRLEGVKAAIEMLDESRTLRYVGQEVAAVAAVDEATCLAALAAIELEIEELPLTLGLEQGRKSDSTEVWPGKKKNPPNAGEGPPVPGVWEGNVRSPRFGILDKKPKAAVKAIDQARSQGTPLVEEVWRSHAQIHTTLEPHCALARWNDDGSLTVHKSSQACLHAAHKIAARYGLAPARVELRCEYVGGGFGSKIQPTAETWAAIDLAKVAQAPVLVYNDRPEEMTAGGYRPGVEVELALAAGKEGDWQGLRALAFNDSGVGVGAVTTFQMASVYSKTKGPRKLADIDVVTHVAPGKPFRGPGGPMTSFSLEGAIDQMAHQLGKDPVALRRQWDEHQVRAQVLDWVESLEIWKNRGAVAKDGGRYRRGVGMALGFWSYFYDPLSAVSIEVDSQGVLVRTASQDMGNGTYTLIAKAVAEELSVKPWEIRVELGNSHLLHGPTAGGSRSANSLYEPTRKAAASVKQAYLDKVNAAGKQARAVEGGLEIDGQVHSWSRLAGQYGAVSKTEQRGTDRLIEGLGQYVLRMAGVDFVFGQGNSAGAYVAEVEVDTLLGKVKPLRVWGGMGVGKIFVPDLARSQCYGGVIQGLGLALYEEKFLDPKTGLVLTANLEDYHLPGIAETPEIQIDFLEKGFEHVAGQGVGLAELCTLPVTAAVANAVFHATGWRPLETPLVPARVLEGLKSL